MSLSAQNNAMHSIQNPTQWIGRDGLPLACAEKVNQLNSHLQDIRELCQQTFAEATQMGCSEEFLRIVLQDLILSLKRSPTPVFS